MTSSTAPTRWIGLDLHKTYLVATGVNDAKEQVFGPFRVQLSRFPKWAKTHLSAQDAIVLEMTTNSWEVHDLLAPLVHSVTVVHPPHVKLITRAQVMTDKKAAYALARLHAAGLLTGIWVPPQEVRDLRALVAQRGKLVKLVSQAKNRLHAVLHRHHLPPPPPSNPFRPQDREWWTSLDVSPHERLQLESNFDTLLFAKQQVERIEGYLGALAAQDERVPYLIQLPGIGMVSAMTILAAIGDITRFPSAKQLVGYAGLGARVHDSGQSRRTGRITKAGRRELRSVLVEAAHAAARTHPHWKEEYQRLQVRLGTGKAMVAIARKLLVAVWHVLTHRTVDRHAQERQVACSFFAFAYKVGVKQLPGGRSAKEYVRHQLDELGIGAQLTHLPWGSKSFKLPPSSLPLNAPRPAKLRTQEGVLLPA